MNVADAMTPRAEVVTVSLPGTRGDALTYLQERGFSSLPVVKETAEGEAYRGLVSRADLIEQPEEDQLALLLREVPTVAPDASLVDAARQMRETGERRAPVVDDELVGILTVTDVVRAVARDDVPGEAPVGDLVDPAVNTTYVETPLTVVERELYHADVPYAVVLDGEGDMAGIVTEVDIVAVARVVEGEDDTGESVAAQDDEWMWEGIKPTGNRYLPTRNVEIPAEPVRSFMTGDVTTVTRRKTARETARSMMRDDVEQLPLVAGGSLAGVVRDVDLLGALDGIEE
ncbi:MAG: hemolysin related proteins containing CBS domain protein [uncultured archaeon A07HB70]|jgi:Hemolysins and related proteins containing CBS domains|nr:MAG: hemolysin related proteins containing CBS domain protein [uncultured archaeon A07HB70]